MQNIIVSDIKQYFNISKKDKIEIFIITIIGTFAFSFYFFNPSFFYPGRIIQSIVIYYLLFILLYLENFKVQITIPLIILFIHLFIYNYSGIFNWNSINLSNLFFSGTNILLLFAISYKRMKGEIFLKAFNNIVFIFILCNIFSLLIYIIIVILNINLPYELINLGGRGFIYRNYFHIAIFNDYAVYQAGIYKVLRLCGIFEEPGMLGTYVGIIMIFDFIFFPNKKNRKIILLIYGVLTLSMAFYSFLFFISTYLLFQKKGLKITVITLIFVLIIVLCIPSEIKNVFEINLIQRFYFNRETLRFEGDSRYTLFYNKFQNYIKYYSNNWQILFGNGKGSNSEHSEARYSAYYGIIYEEGYIGFFNILIFLFYFFIYRPIKNNKSIVLLLTVPLILSIYQGRTSADFLMVFHCICLDYKLRMDINKIIDYKK